MKVLIITATLIYSATSFALSSFPEGEFIGQGWWSDNKGIQGNYIVSAISTTKSIESTYTFNGETKRLGFDAEFDEHGFFSLIVGGIKTGSGYCKTVQCHYEIDIGPTKVEETLTFYNNRLYRLGSKTFNETRIIWEEVLEPNEK